MIRQQVWQRICQAAAIPATALGLSGAMAEAVTYDFADPKGVNGVMFVLDSEVEPFVGIGGGITGEVTYDPAEPTSFSGSISLDATTLQLVSGRMTDVMYGADWLNVEERPTITVTFNETHQVVEDDPEAPVTLIVEGTLSFGPFSIEKEFEIEPTFVENGGTQRGAGQGDLLVLRCEFTVNRFDLGIEDPSDKVSPEITVFVPIVGYVKAAE